MATGIKNHSSNVFKENDLMTTKSISENQKRMIVNLILWNVRDCRLLLEA